MDIMSKERKIIKNPPEKIGSKKNQIDLIDDIDLPKEKLMKVLSTVGAKITADNVPIFNRIFRAIERVDKEVREEKLKILLNNFQFNFKSIDEALSRLGTIFNNRAGIILFQKIIQILDAGIADEEWINLLSNVLKNISDEEIEEKFEESTYILSQIARLSPQALLILSKGEKWSSVKFTGSTTMSKQTIVGDWDTQVASFFSQAVEITDDEVKFRISHSFRELESTGMIFVTPSKSLGCTQIGARVQRSIN